MQEFLELTIDKFTFKVARDRLYTEEGLWARSEGKKVRIGLSDFLQKHSGDIAFVDVKPKGAHVRVGEEIAAIETVKVNVNLSSPITGIVVEANPALESAPETINADPYGTGWLAVIEPGSWSADSKSLLVPEAYLEVVRRLAGGGG